MNENTKTRIAAESALKLDDNNATSSPFAPSRNVSVSRANALPGLRDIKDIKRIFVGANRSALSMLPSEHNYVNQHPYVLHLWSCLDKDVLPDFTHGTGSI